MGTITVPYRVLAKGYRITGGRTEPQRATVPYLVAWSDAFAFYNEILGSVPFIGPSALVVPNLGTPFPPSPNLYANHAEIEPCGINGAPISAAFMGLAPGEYFSFAKITVDYDTPPYGDPNNQLDPANPITFCEQEVELTGKLMTRKAVGWKFADGTPVLGDFAVPAAEARLLLTFPQIPYMPWQDIEPFLCTVNENEILGCASQTLLFEGTTISANPTNQGLMAQKTKLVFAKAPFGATWNQLVDKTGNYQNVVNTATGDGIFLTSDFRQMFL